MKKIHCFKCDIAIISVILCWVLWGCSTYNSSETEYVSDIATSDRSVLTERQKHILAEESLPTDLDELTASQKRGIMNIENAFLYLDEKYPGIEFDYVSHYPAGLMGQEKTDFIPKGYDKEDSRNLITVEKDRKGIFDDRNGYMLVAVRETMEKVITEYVESYFGEGNIKVYIHPYLAEMEYGDEINENTVKDKVKSTAVLFASDELCTETQLDAFSDNYKNDGHDFECEFRATIIRKSDFEGLTFNNCGDMYDSDHIIYDIDIE